MKILCLIPARSGSKGVPDKNIKIMIDKPLIAWSIEHAKNSTYYKEGLMRIIVSTDSDEYKKIALEWGAEVPFLRPTEISSDESTDIEFMKHALARLDKDENYRPDYILHLRPTHPCRPVDLIDKCLHNFINSDYDSLRTVIPTEKTPYKMYTKEGDELKPLFTSVNGVKHPYNMGRQYLPKTYLHNGYVDIIKYELISNRNELSGKILAYEMNYTYKIDIDTEEDWGRAANALKHNY